MCIHELRIQLELPFIEQSQQGNSCIPPWNECDYFYIQLVSTSSNGESMKTMSEPIPYTNVEQAEVSVMFLIPDHYIQDCNTSLVFELYGKILIYGKEPLMSRFGSAFVPKTLKSCLVLPILSLPSHREPNELVIGSLHIIEMCISAVGARSVANLQAFYLVTRTRVPVKSYVKTVETGLEKSIYTLLLDTLEKHTLDALDKIALFPCKHPCHVTAACYHSKVSNQQESHSGALSLVRNRLNGIYRNQLLQIEHHQSQASVNGFGHRDSKLVTKQLLCLKGLDKKVCVYYQSCILEMEQLHQESLKYSETSSETYPSFDHIDKVFISLGLKSTSSKLRGLAQQMQKEFQVIATIAKSSSGYHVGSSELISQINIAIAAIANTVQTITRHIACIVSDISSFDPKLLVQIRQIDMSIQVLSGNGLSARQKNAQPASMRLQSPSTRAFTPFMNSRNNSINDVCDLAACVVDRTMLLIENLTPAQTPCVERIADHSWSAQVLYDPITLQLISTIATVFTTTLYAWVAEESWFYPDWSYQDSDQMQKHSCRETCVDIFISRIWPFLAEVGYAVPFGINETRNLIASYGVSLVWQVIVELRHRLCLNIHPENVSTVCDSSNGSPLPTPFRITIDTMCICISVPIKSDIYHKITMNNTHNPIKVIPLLSVSFDPKLFGRHTQESLSHERFPGPSFQLACKVNENTTHTLKLYLSQVQTWKNRHAKNKGMPSTCFSRFIPDTFSALVKADRDAQVNLNQRLAVFQGNHAAYIKSIGIQNHKPVSLIPQDSFKLVCRLLRELSSSLTPLSVCHCTYPSLFTPCALETPSQTHQTTNYGSTSLFNCHEQDAIEKVLTEDYPIL
ncbi:hypothetical protein QVD99_007763 [Batrachochytrium dendrobatidis]|nr:hypothetical protein QVD99_007763 [Batrachochytrium dendrobatidis]